VKKQLSVALMLAALSAVPFAAVAQDVKGVGDEISKTGDKLMQAADAKKGSTTQPSAQDAAAQAQAMLDKSIDYLLKQQNPNGSFGNEHMPPAVTALVLRSLVQDKNHPYSSEPVKKGYAWLIAQQQPDGGIYKDMLANYNTSIAISALGAVKDEPEIKPVLEKAVAYLKGTQWTADKPGPKGEKPGDPNYTAWEGGFSYNPQHGRPDLSNVHFSIQALHDAGLAPNDPAFIAAQKFITRSQNRSESNDQPWSGNDGGFVYSPSNGGDSEAEDYVGPDGKKMWRSYGTMTYAGLKSMLYAGITKDDPRVKAAVDWCRANWTMDENPGLRLHDPKQAQDGLFYYFHVMAKALHAYGEPTIADTQGASHEWRQEMITKLAGLQQPDGSWIGGKRWMENIPLITTCYATLALEEVQKDLADHPLK